jgi:hypothetical protein
MPVSPEARKYTGVYHADDTFLYLLVLGHNHALAGGFTPGGGLNHSAFPKKWIPRHMYGIQVDPGGNKPDRHARIVVADFQSAAWLTDTTFTLQPYGVFQITGRVGEKRSIGAKNWDGVATPPNERVTIRYIGDNGDHYQLVTSRWHAAAVGAPIPDGSEVPFPKIWTPRHYGTKNADLTGTDQKAVIVEPDPDSTIWRSDGVFDFVSTPYGTFTTTGRIAEDRPRGAPAL